MISDLGNATTLMSAAPVAKSGEDVTTNGGNASQTKGKSDNISNAATFPPPKTDKPRPHVCQECKRSFARLEHLKRHERSHTKEKPFQCPECQRCFARRDLLLRHQQKLHQAGAASTRPRGGRRESTSSTQPSGAGRVRKNSVASSVGNPVNSSMRPRANTISHIDGPTLDQLIASANSRSHGYPSGVSHHHSHSSYGGSVGFDYRGIPSAYGQHDTVHGLPKLNTHGLNISLGGGLRTAPLQGMVDTFGIDKLLAAGSTINPAQLHFGGSFGSPMSPFHDLPPFHDGPGIDEEDNDFDWNAPLDGSMVLNGEHALDGSSPSAISSASQSGFSEVMLDGSNNPVPTSGTMWQNPIMASSMVPDVYPMVDTIGPAVFTELIPPMNTVSPHELHDQNASDNFLFSSPPPLTALSPTSTIPGMPNQYFHPPLAFNSDTTSVSSASVNGSARQSSVTSVSTDSITDATRQALLVTLSQPAGFGHTHRNFSQPSANSPTSPGFGSRPSYQNVSLPSTADLQRYVSAYLHYFHPHMPFLHVPTLSFDSPIFTADMRSHNSFSHDGVVGGGGCLILAMAAIGASYEFEAAAAKELFEAAKRMIALYLEERRKSGYTAASNASNNQGGRHTQRTPLWLVQAMLLNLIYGHQCGDKLAAEIATTHCAALVSLAKAAELEKPDLDNGFEEARSFAMRDRSMEGDIEMSEDGRSPESWNRNISHEGRDLQAEWYRWKLQEERKRTLFSVFVLSSLLVTALNQAPKILNSELHVSLPCEEDIWAADSAQAWVALGGTAAAEKNSVSFAEALSFLLTASNRHQNNNRLPSAYHPTFGSSIPLDELPVSELKPSTFGCYILINALHVYIWETRQRHNGRLWKSQETEQMHAQIEPALKAWQAAWRANPHHSLERPNPYGPLPADSIPLLDLAYVRLFVNLGRSKLAFWDRDFEAMAEELGRGIEIIQHAEDSRDGSSEPTESSMRSSISPGPTGSPQGANMRDMSSDMPKPTASAQPGQCSKRERHLRKAAFYAADSLTMSDKLGVTFAEFTSRELPIQSAMCTFDCVQVLAEWVATVQERVGRFLGIIGRDEIDYSQVPAIMLLGEEDYKLIQKITEIIDHAQMKIDFEAASSIGGPSGPSASSVLSKSSGYGSKLLLVTAHMLEKAAVWPVTRVMARALETHAMYLNHRAEASLTAQ